MIGLLYAGLDNTLIALTCFSVHLQVLFLQKVSYISWWGQRHQLSCRTGWPYLRRWPNPYPTTSSSPPTTHTWQVAYTAFFWTHTFQYLINSTSEVFLSVTLQPVSSRVCPLRRCTVSVCCPAAAVWSWTAGRANLQMKSPSLPMASPWPLRSSSRCLHGSHTLHISL